MTIRRLDAQRAGALTRQWLATGQGPAEGHWWAWDHGPVAVCAADDPAAGIVLLTAIAGAEQAALRDLLQALRDRAMEQGRQGLRVLCPVADALVPVLEAVGFGADQSACWQLDLVACRQLQRLLENWQPDLVGTLLFVRQTDRLLLMRKRRGHGAGRINGPGGKLEPGESPATCAIRETREELGIEVKAPRLAARLRFVETQGDQWLGYAFVARTFTGVPHATAEGEPLWVPMNAIPYDRMWPDDRLWLPRVLAGELLEGDFLFQDGRLLAHELRPLPGLRC